MSLRLQCLNSAIEDCLLYTVVMEFMTSSSHRMIVPAQYKFLQTTIDSREIDKMQSPQTYSVDPMNFSALDDKRVCNTAESHYYACLAKDALSFDCVYLSQSACCVAHFPLIQSCVLQPAHFQAPDLSALLKAN